MPADTDVTLPLPGLSPVAGKPIIARFDGGSLSSDGGLLALREVEARLGVARRLAACIDDPRALIRMARAMVALYCASFRQVPRRITLDIQPGSPRTPFVGWDDSFGAVHGGQQLRLFNAYYDDYGFQPIVVFDADGRPVAAMLRPARRPTGAEARAVLRRLVREVRGHWPRVEILIRADSHLRAGGAGFLPRGAHRLPAWRRHHHHAAPACRDAGGQHRTSPRGRARQRQAAAIQGIPRRRRQLEPRRADHRSRRGQRARSTKTSTAAAARPRTTSRRGSAISPPIELRAAVPPPTSSA